LRRLEREARKDETERKEAKRKDRDWQESLQWMVQSLKAKGESKSPKPANPAPPVVPNPGESRSLQTAKGGTSPAPVPSSPANPGQSNPIKPSPEPVATPSNESPAPNPLKQMGVAEVSIPPEIQPNPGESRVLADGNPAPSPRK
ncbi:MAG TPA: hypothetical protein VHH73_13775, partial [Verrucomicrobiae bacterium]|nr:hypothetical protein [Verrucomicrobiae bacterium]